MGGMYYIVLVVFGGFGYRLEKQTIANAESKVRKGKHCFLLSWGSACLCNK
jgi:hypothetical protein